MPMIDSDRSLFEVFHRNDVSNNEVRTCAPHRRYRPYLYKQDREISTHPRELFINQLPFRLPEKCSFKTD
jgi:hypothetical protein